MPQSPDGTEYGAGRGWTSALPPEQGCGVGGPAGLLESGGDEEGGQEEEQRRDWHPWVADRLARGQCREEGQRRHEEDQREIPGRVDPVEVHGPVQETPESGGSLVAEYQDCRREPVSMSPGVTRRKGRLSDRETERRMLDAAVAKVAETGLTVTLEHISFEDVIREAGVARSAVYRRWPYKDNFFSDLLREVARAATLLASGDNSVDLIREVVLDRDEDLRTAAGRLTVAFEILRRGALRDFDHLHGSTQWRTYLALQATFSSLDDGDLRTEVRDALAASEQQFVQRIASSYQQVAELLGLRLRPQLNATYETLATLASATLRGLVVTALSTPSIASTRQVATLADEPAEWSLPALGIASLAGTFLEPDPAVRWGAARATAVREAVLS